MIKRAVGVQFHPWDQVYHFDGQEVSLKAGDHVIVKTELGLELGKVVSFSEVDEGYLDAPLKPIIRRATHEDLKKTAGIAVRQEEIMAKARDLVTKHNLDMKLVDCYFSFDGGKITFVFTAEGRVDFRELVKDMAREFQKSIRLQQVGIRDEARRMGGFGQCGRELCCRKFLQNLSSVTTDYARLQQVHTRGSDRISGACGRLMCCLAYEAENYQESLKEFPALESQVKAKQGQGRVVSNNIIKKTVTVSIDNNLVELPLKEVKQI